MITCFTNYLRKSYENVRKCLIMLLMSYLTKLCKKRVNKTRIKEGKPKEEQVPFRHSEICRHGVNEFQNASIQLATTNQRAKVCHSEGRASKRVRTDSRDHVFHVQSSPWRNIPASWRAKTVLERWRMTWQKPTGKERSAHHGELLKLYRSIKAHSLISKHILLDL